jgi:hypothetical protein
MFGRIPLNEWLDRRKGRDLHNKYKMRHIHAFSEIRTRNPRNRALADLFLRAHGNLLAAVTITVPYFIRQYKPDAATSVETANTHVGQPKSHFSYFWLSDGFYFMLIHNYCRKEPYH